MKMTVFENTTIALATIFIGVMTGFFWTYSFNINFAMMQIDGQTYAKMQSLFNQNVRHSIFFFFFFGAGIISIIAVLANIKRRKNICFKLLVLSATLYCFGIIIFTAQVNLPLNAYTESWDINKLPEDWQTIRAQWNDANLIRVITSFSSFILGITVLLIRTSKSVVTK